MASGVASAAAERREAWRRRSIIDEPPKPTEALWGLFFISPFLIVALVFLVAPIFYSFYLSLRETTIYTSWFNQFGEMKFVGLANYASLLQSKQFWWSLIATGIYAVLIIPGSIAAGLALALVLNPKLPGYRALRAGFFLPHVFDVFVVGLIWLLLYDATGGPFGRLFGHLLPNGSSLLSNPWTILPAIAVAMILKGMGFGMVLFVTALNNIPESIFEAADIDGCSRSQKLRHVTIPMLRPMILFLAVTGLVGVLNAFTEFYSMTRGTGDPSFNFLGDTAQVPRVAGFHLYRFFDVGQYGTAAAMSFLLLLIALVITAVNFKVLGEKK